MWIHDLDRRWQEEEARTRVIVNEQEAIFRADMRTTAPPQVLWEFVTTPGRRVAWTPGMTGVEVIASGNRRGVGATNHCMHGKNASIEELLDWRPYDYYTLRNTVPMPIGSVSFLLTNELEPTLDGTILHMRAGAPETRLGRLAMKLLARMVGRGMEAAHARLASELGVELARRAGDGVVEPDLPRPRPGGPLASLPPGS